LLASGIILGVQGLIKANNIADLDDPSSDSLSLNTSYLLQVRLICPEARIVLKLSRYMPVTSLLICFSFCFA
jgi:hypothetical protein